MAKLTIADLAVPPVLASHVPPNIVEAIREHWRCSVITIDRVDALEALWSAWKSESMERTGYAPEFTAAVQRLRELERS